MLIICKGVSDTKERRYKCVILQLVSMLDQLILSYKMGHCLQWEIIMVFQHLGAFSWRRDLVCRPEVLCVLSVYPGAYKLITMLVYF